MFSVLVVFFIVGCIFCDTLCISLYYNHAVLLVYSVFHCRLYLFVYVF